jgi:5-methylthioadenosine/S-adenosylhomocysteine deaminase
MTMVAGRIVAEAGTTTLVNEADILAEAREVFARKAPALADAAAAMNRLLPFYDEMYFRASAIDVGVNRKLGEARIR